MERIEDDGKVTYKKIGGGILYWDGKPIFRGNIRLRPEDVPAAFKDLLIPLEQIKEKAEAPIEIARIQYEIRPRGKSKSLFDVVHVIDEDNFKILNEKALTKEIAQNLITDLQK